VTGPDAPRPPRSGARSERLDEALARAARHARNALAETLAAAGALLDAASLAAWGEPAAAGRLAALADGVERLHGWLAGAPGEDAAALLRALSEALDVEIGRWEERGRDDPDARAVLRAFLAVRELLWEVGLRTPAPAAGPADAASVGRAARGGRARARRSGRRVQRVIVEG
jgi:hypothetical protein